MTVSSSAAVAAGDFADTAEKPRTFLIVDDSPVIRRRLASLLAETDGVCLIGESDNAIQAAEMIHDLGPEVVIVDIRMPDRTGIGLLESIKDSSELPVIIVLTNYPYSAYRKRCVELGATHFFDKSSEFDEMEEVVRSLARVGV